MSLRDDLRPEADLAVLDTFDQSDVDQFYQFLKDKNLAGGFFSAGDTERIADRHLFESLAYVRRIMSLPGVSRETKILDAGSGPGLPGYLFSCLIDPPYVTLLDSSRRRLSLLEKFHAEIPPERKTRFKGRVRFQYARAEESKGNYDVVIARALIPYPFNAVLLRHLIGGCIALAAGPSPVSPETEKVLHRYGLYSEEPCRMHEIDFLGERNLLIVRKENPSRALPPVEWKQLKSEMDQWRRS